MIDLSTRSSVPEIMDDLQISGEVVGQTLRELEVINRLLGGNQVTVTGLSALLKNWNESRPVRITDMGCGGGDMLIRISNWARKKGIPVELTGVDANPHIVEYARTHSKGHSIKYLQENIFDFDAIPESDIVIATLFLHHFSESELANILKEWSKRCALGIVVNDIHRHWLAFHSIALLTRWFSKSKMVINDAPLSVQRAFRRQELEEILMKASLDHYDLRWAWAFRWSLVIRTGSLDQSGDESVKTSLESKSDVLH